jgi:hypothetical protein
VFLLAGAPRRGSVCAGGSSSGGGPLGRRATASNASDAAPSSANPQRHRRVSFTVAGDHERSEGDGRPRMVVTTASGRDGSDSPRRSLGPDGAAPAPNANEGGMAAANAERLSAAAGCAVRACRRVAASSLAEGRSSGAFARASRRMGVTLAGMDAAVALPKDGISCTCM